MTPEEYCRNKAAPAGSNLYYATLYHEPAPRRRLYALFALHNELTDVVCASSDPGAARVTLHWWLEELDRLFSGAAKHPVSQELSRFEHAECLSRQGLMGCVVALAQCLDIPDSVPYQSLLTRHEAAAGQIWKTAGRVCGCADQRQLATLASAGACHGVFELLHHARRRATGPKLNALPSDLLAKHELNQYSVFEPGMDANVSAFFADLFDRLRRDLEGNLALLQKQGASAPLFALVLLKILKILCHEYHNASEPITHSRIFLTPVRKLWIAWRTARRPDK